MSGWLHWDKWQLYGRDGVSDAADCCWCGVRGRCVGLKMGRYVGKSQSQLKYIFYVRKVPAPFISSLQVASIPAPNQPPLPPYTDACGVCHCGRGGGDCHTGQGHKLLGIDGGRGCGVYGERAEIVI